MMALDIPTVRQIDPVGRQQRASLFESERPRGDNLPDHRQRQNEDAPWAVLSPVLSGLAEYFRRLGFDRCSERFATPQ